MIAGRVRLRYQRQIARHVGYHLPEQAFHGAMLEALTGQIDLHAVDRSTKEQILAFIKSFISCSCRDNPFCGCAERRFAKEVIELRESGLDHRHVAEYLNEEYGIEIYPADIISYLEESVHVLEAIRDVAALVNNRGMLDKADAHITAISEGELPESG